MLFKVKKFLLVDPGKDPGKVFPTKLGKSVKHCQKIMMLEEMDRNELSEVIVIPETNRPILNTDDKCARVSEQVIL